MGRTRRYILGSFVRNYLLVFLPFLLIVSVIFVIQLSILSSKVNIGFTELIRLFGYMLPEIFFYTIPFSLIAALANTFSRFSEENEFIALFALGHTPRKILLTFVPTLLLFSAFLLTLSLMLYPQMKQKINHFKHQKVAEATLRIVPNKLSQSFGNFHVFVESKDDNGTYRNMVLFNRDTAGKYQLFIAKRGRVSNDKIRYTLRLNEGIGETSDAQKVETVSYRELAFYQYPRAQYATFLTSEEYWKEAAKKEGRLRKLLYLTFVSLSPILSFGLLASLTFYNPRYQRGLASFAIFLVALFIYLPAAILQKYGTPWLFVTLVVGMLLLGIVLIRQRILKRF